MFGFEDPKLIRYHSVIAYDGSNYSGWQSQKNNDNCIQKRIENGLKIIFKKEIKVFAAGRTDKGVHAHGQSIHFDTHLSINPERLLYALNKILTPDIKFIKINIVSDCFHARHSALSKTYEYVIKLTELNVFESRFKVYVKNFNINLAKEAACKFIGTYDFQYFAKIDDHRPTIKTIYNIEFILEPNELKIVFHGNGFLKYMVRRMVGAIIMVATQKVTLKFIDECFLGSNKKSVITAKPNGLYLVKVDY